MVRRAREAREWTQGTLSRRLMDEADTPVDQSGIARIEAGRRVVRLNEVVALSKVLGIALNHFNPWPAVSPDDRTPAAVAHVAVEINNLRAEIDELNEQLAAAESMVAATRRRIGSRTSRRIALESLLKAATEPEDHDGQQ